MMKMMKQPGKRAMAVISICVLLLSMGSGVHGATSSTMKMAERLASLRKEVDGLAGELEEKKEESRGRIRSFATQKAEVEAEMQRAKMRLAQLQESHSKRVAQLSEEDTQMAVLSPAVLEAIGMLKKKVAAGIPFKREERTAELDRLIRQIDDKLLHPVNALARLWDQTEDEFRLAKESGMYRQVVSIGGTETLADVIRIGMVSMYVQTRDGTFGRSVDEGDGWRFETLRTKEQHRQILLLFDSFKKQIRSGLFTLPTAIPKGEVR